MSNLLFSLNATLPIFLIMMFGYFLREVGLIHEDFATKMNSFVFKIALPISLFQQLYSVNFRKVWNWSFVLFCFFATLISILIAWGLSHLVKDKSIRGEFVQGTYRSSASLLGMAYIQNIYGTGNAAMGSLMMIGAVPLYNIFAVIILSVMNPKNETAKLDHKLVRSTCLGILKNPIILGIVAGALWAALRIPIPAMLDKTVSMIGSLASPMGLLAMGALIDFKKIKGKLPPAIGASLMKLFGFAALFLPAAAALGFRNQQLIAILIMLGSATTLSSFVMAKSMGHEGTLSSTIVMITTLGSSFSLTFFIFILRSLGLV